MKSTPTVETLYKKLEEVVERFEDTYDSKVQSAVTNGHWCGGKRPQCGASAASLS